MLKFANLLEAKAEEIAILDPMSMGISIGLSGGTLIPSCVETFRCELNRENELEAEERIANGSRLCRMCGQDCW